MFMKTLPMSAFFFFSLRWNAEDFSSFLRGGAVSPLTLFLCLPILPDESCTKGRDGDCKNLITTVFSNHIKVVLFSCVHEHVMCYALCLWTPCGRAHNLMLHNDRRVKAINVYKVSLIILRAQSVCTGTAVPVPSISC